MRQIIVVTFMTMDGVMQAPGGPDEDRSNGFKWGGWQFGYTDETSGQELSQLMARPFDLLLGRRTYEIFSAYWPYQQGAIAEKFNQINKYVVSGKGVDTSWSHSVLIGDDVPERLRALKANEGPDLLVHGSGQLVQTLFAHDLVDVLQTWTCPITIGQGKRLFAEGTPVREWTLQRSVVTLKGVVIATYHPGGAIRKGSFVEGTPSAAELARRKRWTDEG